MALNDGTRRAVSAELKSQDDLEMCLRLLKRKLKREGFFVEMRKREFYRKPSELKKLKKRRRKLSDGTELS